MKKWVAVMVVLVMGLSFKIRAQGMLVFDITAFQQKVEQAVSTAMMLENQVKAYITLSNQLKEYKNSLMRFDPSGYQDIFALINETSYLAEKSKNTLGSTKVRVEGKIYKIKDIIPAPEDFSELKNARLDAEKRGDLESYQEYTKDLLGKMSLSKDLLWAQNAHIINNKDENKLYLEESKERVSELLQKVKSDPTSEDSGSIVELLESLGILVSELILSSHKQVEVLNDIGLQASYASSLYSYEGIDGNEEEFLLNDYDIDAEAYAKEQSEKYDFSKGYFK